MVANFNSGSLVRQAVCGEVGSSTRGCGGVNRYPESVSGKYNTRKSELSRVNEACSYYFFSSDIRAFAFFLAVIDQDSRIPLVILTQHALAVAVLQFLSSWSASIWKVYGA